MVAAPLPMLIRYHFTFLLWRIVACLRLSFYMLVIAYINEVMAGLGVTGATGGVAFFDLRRPS